MTTAPEAAGHSLIEIDPVELLGYTPGPCDPSASEFVNLVLKEGNIFFLTDERGNAGKCQISQLGMFHEDTRFLSRWELQVLGHEPQVLSSQANRVFCNQIDLTTTWNEGVKDIYEHNFIHIRRRQVLHGRLVERLRISNYLNFFQRITLAISFAADFLDMFEVRGMERERRGTYYRPVVEEKDVFLYYRGLDDLLRVTQISFEQKPTRLSHNEAAFEIVLPANGTFLLEMHVIPSTEQIEQQHFVSYAELYRLNSESYSEWDNECTSLKSDDEFLDASLTQSITDLRALMIAHEDQHVISAGIPWYSTGFGRDPLITSLESMMINPNIARTTLLFLVRYQGEKVDEFTAEEPGKILHEIRRGELAKCGEIPHVPYYGTVDATPLFLILLHEYFLWTGDEEFIQQMLPHAERALQWIDEYGDVDGDGFVEYWKYTERGILHQGWKDSIDGVIFPDGTQPQLPIALIEVQGYVFQAKMRMSRLYRTLGKPDRARQLRTEAGELQGRIDASFWMKDQRFYALALDSRKQIVPSITSNPAHLLYSEAVNQATAGRIEKRLMSEEMFSGWGIRTFSANHQAYNPLSYHNGTVWPHDNALAVMGLCNYTLKHSAERIFTSLFEACMHFQYYRLPELFCGMLRQPNDSPVHYPVACTPQAWAAASFFMMLQGLIGISPDAPQRRLYIRNPRLPAVVSDLLIKDMRVGGTRVTLRITRQGDRTFVNVVEHSGDPIRVTIEWD